MSERAYSEELKREISAIEAQRRSLNGELQSAKAFHCHDDSCGIKLTCTNWKVHNAKNVFYTPSNRSHLHSITCSTISISDEKRQIEVETEEGKTTINKSGIISMEKVRERARTVTTSAEDKDDTSEDSRVARNNVKTDRNGTENRNISSIKTYINFYYDDEIDNEEPIFKVDGKLINLNTLFVDARQEVKKGVTRIFHGIAFLKTSNFSPDVIAIEFIDSGKPCIYTNKKQLFTRISSRTINKYLDKDVIANVFFRGNINEQKKFESFNGKFYCDLFILEE